MRVKKALSFVLVAGLVMTMLWIMPLETKADTKSTTAIRGAVYSPGKDVNSSYGSPPSQYDCAFYATATFYTPNDDQTGADKYDVQYYGKLTWVTAIRPHAYGYSPQWKTSENLSVRETEYMVVAEIITGINGWTGANYTGSTNKTSTDSGPDPDDLPNIYLEEIPTPSRNSHDNATGTINITWNGLYENISEAYWNDLKQDWYGYAKNIVGYSVYRSKDGDEFERAGNATQNRGGKVYFEESGLLPGIYRYKIAVNYRYPANNGTNIIDQNGMHPENTKFPWIFVSTGRSNASDVITMSDVKKPTITNIYPENDVTIITNTTTISANYSDDSGVDISSVILRINGVDYTLKGAVITKTGVSYYYPNIPDGNYTVYLEVKDNSTNHNNATKTWFFKVDATSPNVTVKAPTGDKVLVLDAVEITFSEPMNTTISMADIFSIEPDVLGTWHWDWYGDDTTVRGTHNNFTVNTTYNCSINTNAKDKPGNHLDKNYLWNFTTIANLSVTLNWPYVGTERWTGGSNHTISYSVGGGLQPYTVYLNYTTDGGVSWFVCSGVSQPVTHSDTGIFTYVWTLPLNMDSSNCKVKIDVNDSATPCAFVSKQSGDFFVIDSIKPTVNQSWPLNGSYTPLGSDIVIVFDESMNTTAVGASGGSLIGCSCTPDPGGWTAVWSDSNKKLTLSHNDFTADQLYTFTVTTGAKDKSEPGNHLNKSYSWNFTAVPGKGVFTVDIDCPTSAEVGKEYQVTVTVNNAGLPTAYNSSGTLTIKFYKIYPGEAPIPIDTKTIDAMLPGGSDTKSSALFTFDKPGTWYIKVELSSTNSIDVIQGYTQSYDASNSVEVVKPGEAPAGIPYPTIAAGVIVLLVLIGIAVTLIKKKKIG